MSRKSVRVTIDEEPAIVKRIDEAAEREGCSRAAFVRRGIRMALKEASRKARSLRVTERTKSSHV